MVGKLIDFNSEMPLQPVMNISFETFKELFKNNKVIIPDKKTS